MDYCFTKRSLKSLDSSEFLRHFEFRQAQVSNHLCHQFCKAKHLNTLDVCKNFGSEIYSLLGGIKPGLLSERYESAHVKGD